MKKVTIIVTRYNEPNSLIEPCLNGLSKQKNINAIVYFLDQKKDKEIERLCKELSNKNIKIIYKKIPIKSLSYARNLGIKLAKTDLVLFTDSDAIPNDLWAYELTKIYDLNKKIVIVGGASYPKWLKNPRWYHKSNIVLELYSLINLSNEVIPTEKVVGVNFSLSKLRLGKLSNFKENLGRKDGKLLGGEETDMCSNVKEKGLFVYFNPKAIVAHQIPEERVSFGWVIKRMYFGGYSRALRGENQKLSLKKEISMIDYYYH